MLDRESFRHDHVDVRPLLNGRPLVLPPLFRWTTVRFEDIADLFAVLLEQWKDSSKRLPQEGSDGIGLGERHSKRFAEVFGWLGMKYGDFLRSSPLLQDGFYQGALDRLSYAELRYIYPLLNSLRSLYGACRELSWMIYRAIKDLDIPLVLPIGQVVKGNDYPDVGIIEVSRYFPVDGGYPIESYLCQSPWILLLYRNALGIEYYSHGVWRNLECRCDDIVVLPTSFLQVVTCETIKGIPYRILNNPKMYEQVRQSLDVIAFHSRIFGGIPL